jgi:hypothetical protein
MAPLTPEQEAQRLELIQKQNVAAKELANTYEKMSKSVKGLSDEEKEILDISKKISQQSNNIEKSIKDRINGNKSFFNLTANINKLQRDALKSQSFAKKLEDERFQARAKFGELEADAIKKANELKKLEGDHIGEIDKQLALEAQLARVSASKTKADRDRAKQLAAQIAQGKIFLNETLKNLKAKEKEVEQSKKTVEEQRGLVHQLNDAVTANEKITKEREKEIELAKKARVNNIIDNAAKKLGLDYLTSIEGLYTFIVKSAFKANEQTVKIGKSLGISYDAASKVRDSFVQYSRASKDSFINTDRLAKSQGELSEQLGIAVQFSNEELETFSRLTELVGLSSQEAGNLAKFSAAAGMESKDYVADIRRSAFYAQQANKIHISDKELLSTIGKLSAGILVKFQGNPKALAEAVVQSKKLGISLEQVDKVGDSMLNWESSIQNELEAELITGKQLNFEKARAAALTGDQATLMQEVANQAGSLSDYQNMNVIAQESLAKAFGMSRDEMSEMLMKQEAINKYGDKASELNAKQLEDLQKSGLSLDDYLKQQDERQTAQEKFNNAITKLQDLVGNLVAGPFGKLLDIISSILSHTEVLAAISAVYIGRLIMINALKLKESILSKKSAATDAAGAAANTAKSAASMGPLGWIAAGGAALGIYALLTGLLSKGDDVISPGYGKRMIFSPEGAVALNNNDTIVAGTNLGGKGSDNSGVIAAISNLTNTLSKPAPAPQFALNVNGEKLGDVVGRQQQTGTQQTKNAYRLA